MVLKQWIYVFNKPAREGQLLKIYGIVERVGNTSAKRS